MKTFLVGGAVRDRLLNYPVKEKDWVVIGETPESMVKKGFRPVGKDFPVFLHPENGEEYALARTERKTAPGYKGFVVHASPDVTLEQDLMRRDLTINAIAMTPQGEIIDPYGGKNDIENRIFRHISPAFAEDPVRILRVARFAARYSHLGFRLAEETQALMRQMVTAGEADHLVPERVWAELFKALNEKSPSAFFYTLKDCSALERIFPELYNLFGVPQPEKHHPEIDTGVHAMLCLEQATVLSSSPEVRFAALMHDLGKAVSPKENWPHHYNHERNGLPILENLCARLRVPNSFKSLAMLVMRHHTHCHRAFELRPSTLTDMLMTLGAFKATNNTLDHFLLACAADAKGRINHENNPYPQADYIKGAAKAAASVDISAILKSKLQGAEIGEAIRRLRIRAVAEFIAVE
ncbi:multifunctional CCA addition/repair protein [Methylobacter sp. YRD-M1]|uniref:multifunctional CCA addition/repair protein n=1 Tax=Methylobacter sp. YRD-M1 TaxID=2911520 RepID=UPI00227A55C5|nr:multifunctional CCA addition/repair protein [Methylobacter sp. YRD-M1]WAK02008.1 multifunctional CCA addition/repair protein [Methylobacter sp. YRD-M1]